MNLKGIPLFSLKYIWKSDNTCGLKELQTPSDVWLATKSGGCNPGYRSTFLTTELKKKNVSILEINCEV